MEPRAYKRPESVLVLVYTLAGDVLMLERAQPRGFWQSVTGSLRWGESPRAAAARELYEETGIQATGQIIDCHHIERFPIIPPWRERYAPQVRFNTEHWFRLALAGRRLLHMNPDEHSRYRWVPMQQAARMATSWTNRDAILSLTRY